VNRLKSEDFANPDSKDALILVERKSAFLDKPARDMESMLDIWLCRNYAQMESKLDMEPRVINHVKELRAARGWTQEELAQATGVSRQSINSIERNRYVPSLPLALEFARVFGCSTDEIFQLESKS
jgi:putative transcriptional regulator